jgi:hypothetical protein
VVNERKDIGSFGGTYIPLPQHVGAKRCCVNPDNSESGDNMCFKWAVLAVLHYNDLTDV